MLPIATLFVKQQNVSYTKNEIKNTKEMHFFPSTTCNKTNRKAIFVAKLPVLVSVRYVEITNCTETKSEKKSSSLLHNFSTIGDDRSYTYSFTHTDREVDVQKNC